MENKIRKIQDEDKPLFQSFCPSCHYWFFGENFGSKYCPHCGIKLFWDSEKADSYHEMWYDFSIKRYDELNKYELISLLEQWQNLQHAELYEYCETVVEPLLKEKFDIDMDKEWEEVLEKYHLII